MPSNIVHGAPIGATYSDGEVSEEGLRLSGSLCQPDCAHLTHGGRDVRELLHIQRLDTPLLIWRQRGGQRGRARRATHCCRRDALALGAHDKAALPKRIRAVVLVAGVCRIAEQFVRQTEQQRVVARRQSNGQRSALGIVPTDVSAIAFEKVDAVHVRTSVAVCGVDDETTHSLCAAAFPFDQRATRTRSCRCIARMHNSHQRGLQHSSMCEVNLNPARRWWRRRWRRRWRGRGRAATTATATSAFPSHAALDEGHILEIDGHGGVSGQSQRHCAARCVPGRAGRHARVPDAALREGEREAAPTVSIHTDDVVKAEEVGSKELVVGCCVGAGVERATLGHATLRLG